jgi:hypothetical protein
MAIQQVEQDWAEKTNQETKTKESGIQGQSLPLLRLLMLEGRYKEL